MLHWPDKIPIIKSRQRLLRAAERVAGEDAKYRPLMLAIRQNSGKHYLSVSLDNPAQVAFCAKNTVCKYDSQRRTRTTLQRYLTRRASVAGDYCHCEIERFSTRVMSLATSVDDRFSVLRGDEIVAAYRDEIGGSSCMTGGSSEYVEVYASNPNTVSLVVYRDEKMTARALLWKTNEGASVLDRIYPASGYHVDHFARYAASRGHVQRCGNSLPGGDVRLTDGKAYTADLESPDSGLWPYMDTFRFADDEGQSVTLCNRDNGRYPYVLESTSGGFGDFGETGPRCYHCGAQCGDDDWCDDDGDTICGDCLSNRYTWCGYCDTYRTNDCAVCVENSDTSYCDHCCDDHSAKCYDCGGRYTHDDLEMVIDDEYYCHDCYGQHWHNCECGEVTSTDNALCEDCQQEVKENETVIA